MTHPFRSLRRTSDPQGGRCSAGIAGRAWFALGMVLAGSLLSAAVAVACNIPVFRYALERWQPDRFDVILFTRGPLSTEEQEIAASVSGDRPFGSETDESTEEGNANLLRVDLEQADPNDLALWQSLSAEVDAALPHLLVRTSIGNGRSVHAWHGPLSSARRVGILRSPAREELARRLLAGHSIVWLMIGSDSDARNASVRQMISQQFDALSRQVRIPEGIGLPGSELHSEVPLVIQFSLLEVDRNDEREKLLIDLLSGLQPRSFAEGEPLIVPVFGRGRALEVIPAGDLSPPLMRDLAVFLSGACSCQVKERNPGFDLLIAADWKGELFGDHDPPPSGTPTGQGRRGPVLLTIPPGN